MQPTPHEHKGRDSRLIVSFDPHIFTTSMLTAFVLSLFRRWTVIESGLYDHPGRRRGRGVHLRHCPVPGRSLPLVIEI